MSHVKIRDTDHGYNKLVRRVFGMNRSMDVGLLEATPSNVLEYATYNEFGTSTIPERSFIRAWFDENQGKCRLAVAAMAKAVLAGKYEAEEALEILGQRFAAEIQARIAQGVPPPNAPSTIRGKGSAVPLIDTGALRGAISYQVKPGS